VSAATEKRLARPQGQSKSLPRVGAYQRRLATLLNTSIGYSAAAEVAKESERSGRPVREIVAEKGLMRLEEFDRLVEQAAVEATSTHLADSVGLPANPITREKPGRP